MALNEIDLYKFRGKTYSTAKEIAEAYKVSPRKFRARMIAGWPIEEALEVVKRANPKGKSVAVDGQFFATRRDVAKHFGIEEGTLNKRLSDGWTIEEAVGLVARKALRVGNPKPCTFLGIKFTSKIERNAHFGLENHSIDFIDKRLKRGFTERQAVGLDPPPPRFRSKSGSKRPHSWTDLEEIDGRYYPKTAIGNYQVYLITNLKNGKQYVGVTISDIAARWRMHCSEALRNITDTKIARAIRKYGKCSFKIELLRNDAKNFKELELQEIEEIKQRETIKRGYNISSGGQLASAKPIVVSGKLFASQASAALAYGVDPNLFNLRLANGKSPEQAANLLDRLKYGRIAVDTPNGTWPSLKEACKALNLNYKTVHRRLSVSNWSMAQALGFEPPPNPEHTQKEIIAGEMRFESQAAFARFIGKHPSSVCNWLKNETAEQILNRLKKTDLSDVS